MRESISLIVLCAGSSTRFKNKRGIKKQWLWVGDIPLWKYVTKRLNKFYKFEKIILTSSKKDIEYIKSFNNYKNTTIVLGDDTRDKSVKNALKYINSKYVLITDCARAKITKKLLRDLINYNKNIKNKNDKADCVVPYLNVVDTAIYQKDASSKPTQLIRENIKLIQTPQLCNTKLLKQALSTNNSFSDESTAIDYMGGKVAYIKGDIKAKKLTTIDDLKHIELKPACTKTSFVGYGYDLHILEQNTNKPMLLGGVEIDTKMSLKAHSDGDVLIHSIIDALLGGVALGDIGDYFPDNDDRYKNISSIKLLKQIVAMIYSYGYEIKNIDTTIICEKIKITPYKQSIKEKLQKVLKIDKNKINIKATTNEKQDSVGEGKAIAVHCVANITLFNHKKLKK